jgi:phosphate transport system protein
MNMGAAVESQLKRAVEALATGDLIAIDGVVDDGHAVNAMEVEIDEMCIQILVRRHPTANDLRLIKAIIKIINDLERIGDEAEHIAVMAKLIFQKHPQHMLREQQIRYIAEIALGMLRDALNAFDALDADAAKKIGRRDTLIDDEFRSILRHLMGYMMEDASELTTALQVVFVAKSIENIVHHAKNLSEYVVYMLEGREARNYSPDTAPSPDAEAL